MTDIRVECSWLLKGPKNWSDLSEEEKAETAKKALRSYVREVTGTKGMRINSRHLVDFADCGLDAVTAVDDVKEIPRTPRGFKLYGEFEDAHRCKVSVVESSAVGAPRAWVFVEDVNKVFGENKDPPPYLSVDQAKALISALQTFVKDAQADDNWRNSPEYRELFGGLQQF